MATTDDYTADGPICGCCGSATIPPTPGTDEEGYYCEPCGAAWVDPTQVVGPCMIHGRFRRSCCGTWSDQFHVETCENYGGR